MTRDKISCLTRSSTPLCQDRSLPKSIPMRLSLSSGISGALALSLLAVGSLSAQPADDERSEVAVIVGEVSGGNPTVVAGGALNVDAGVAFARANYAEIPGYGRGGGFIGKSNGIVSPLRYGRDPGDGCAFDSQRIRDARDQAAVCLEEVVSPWLDAGAGYAFLQFKRFGHSGWTYWRRHSEHRRIGQHLCDRFWRRCGFRWKRYLIRGEVRGIYTGNPNFGVPTSGGLFNFVIGGGLVWRF